MSTNIKKYLSIILIISCLGFFSYLLPKTLPTPSCPTSQFKADISGSFKDFPPKGTYFLDIYCFTTFLLPIRIGSSNPDKLGNFTIPNLSSGNYLVVPHNLFYEGVVFLKIYPIKVSPSTPLPKLLIDKPISSMLQFQGIY